MLKVVARGFPDSEFEARCARAQAMMAEADIAALLLTTEPELRYFSGFLTQFWQSPTRPWFMVVPRAGKPIAVIPEIGAECMSRTWLDDIRTWPSPALQDDGVSLLIAAVREAVGDGNAFGVAMGPETHLRMPLLDFEQVTRALALEIADATPIFRQLRMVKSEAEIEKIAHICGIVSDVFEAMPNWLAAGMPVSEVFQRFKIDALERGADDVSYLVGGAGPGGYGDIISPPTDTPLAEGDILILDTGSVFDGYFSDFDRNFAIGRADDASRRAYATVFAATEAGLDAAQPGNTAADLFRAMNAVMEADGALGNDVGRLGHGLGMQLTEWPSNTAWDETPLVPGMVMTLEPGMTYAPGKVMVHEENLVIREDGPQLLSRRAAAELPVV
ncbi:MAG: peptidase M24 [Rhodospirillaceae bacterium]|nr:peptidase M24 [Rhodospirillaceae bacterium]